MIEVTFVLTIDDLMEAGKEGYARDTSVKRSRVYWVVIGVVLIAIALTQKPFPLYWMILLGLLLVWNIVLPTPYLRKHFQKSVTNEQVVAQIDETGVTTESPTSRGEMKWAGVAFWLETPKTFSLVTISNVMYVFPKRAFNEQSCEELRRLIVQNRIPGKPT
jgi:YcxB-like protein